MHPAMDHMLGRQTNYTVQLPVYEGPLDLLLDLIERAELDITTVSLALLTDQYLAYIHGLEQTRADEISAFLVIAAKLLQIKSEALLPRPPVREPGDEDIGQSLVDQLKLYKRYKEIALTLDDRQAAGLRTYLRIAPPPKVEAKLDPSNLTLEVLLAAAASVFEKAKLKEPLASVIAAPRITIREKIDLIAKALKQIPHASFRSLLGERPTRLEIVVTFLALLELVKRYRVEARQDALFSDILIDRLEDWTDGEEIELEFE
jgi:segregation and condensation protein A